MKIQIFSDNHNHKLDINPDVDLVVHAGDFGNAGIYGLLDFVRCCEEANKPYVLVIGNHDYYSHSYTNILKYLDTYDINYLTEGREFVFNGYTFVGGTLFTNFRSNKLLYANDSEIELHKDNAKKFIYDFKAISYNDRLVEPDDYVTEFNKQWNWIQKYKNRGDVIVLTHFPPNLCCLADYWKNHPTDYILNPYFVNDMDLTGFKLWISGHVHHAVDTVVDGCRVITNPLGYLREQGLNGFKSNLILELNND